MPRQLSSGAVQAVLAQHTNQAFILLVTFTSPQSSEVFRCALNTEDFLSQGFTFTGTYFEVALPELSDAAPKGCQITVDNVDRRMVGMLREVTEPIQVKLQLVMASTPNQIEMEFTDLVLREVSWDESKITGTLISDDPLNQVFPGHVYDTRTFPGVF